MTNLWIVQSHERITPTSVDDIDDIPGVFTELEDAKAYASRVCDGAIIEEANPIGGYFCYSDKLLVFINTVKLNPEPPEK